MAVPISSLQQLSDPTKFHRPVMTESDFIKFLLPLIVNIDDVKDLDMSIWLDAAGNPHNQIDVIGPSHEVLFTVPPLLSRVPTEAPTKERNGVDISSILHTYGARRQVEHPAAVDAWFEASMSGVVIDIDEQTTLDYLKQLVVIYTRYGVSTAKILGGYEVKPQEETAAPVKAPEDDLSGEFDDL